MAKKEMSETERQLQDARERISDLNRYINELEESVQFETGRADRLAELLREAGRYVADAGGDEDSETQKLSAELSLKILSELDPTSQPPR